MADPSDRKLVLAALAEDTRVQRPTRFPVPTLRRWPTPASRASPSSPAPRTIHSASQFYPSRRVWPALLRRSGRRRTRW